MTGDPVSRCGPRGNGRLVVALLAAALALRVGWATFAPTELWFDHVFTDATARSILDGRGFTVSREAPHDPAVFRTPGYSVFLAGVYAVGGGSVRSAFVANALLDTLSCLLLFNLVRRRLGERPARWALFLAATYPFTVYAVGTLSPESLLVCLALGFTALVDAWVPCGARWGVIAAGVVAAAMVWVKPVCLPLPLFILLAEKLRGRPWRTGILRAVAVGGIVAVLFAPWIVRNVRAFGKPVLAAEVGLVLLHGTFDFSDERDAMIARRFAEFAAPDPAAGGEGEGEGEGEAGSPSRYERTRREFADSRRILERDAEFRQRAFERMRARPWHAFLLDPLRRVPRLWISTTFTGGPNWVGLGAAAACVAYLALAFGGFVLLRGRLRELAAWWILPVLLTGVYAVFHVEARYTLPARPILLALGGMALARVWTNSCPGPPRS